MSLEYSGLLSANEIQASHYPYTRYSFEASCEVYCSLMVFSFACSFKVHSRSIMGEFPFTIGRSGFTFTRCDSDHLLTIHGCAICIIQYTASCQASLFSVWIECINLFTAEYSASAPCISITGSSSGSSGLPESTTLSATTSHKRYGIPV